MVTEVPLGSVVSAKACPVPVHWVPGEEQNIKVTYPGDLAIAEALLKSEQPA